jgi:phage terminase small subunit
MSKNAQFGDDFLSDAGEVILEALLDHCRAKMKMMDADRFELAMLANSFCLYAENAKVCKDDGVSMTIITEKGGEYSQIRPEYTVMKNEYGNILKHAGKFGLNPGDREKIFKKMTDKPKKKDFSNLKIAK